MNDFIERYNPRTLILHAPDGLKILYKCVENRIPEDIEIYYSSSPGYGACDIPLDEAEVIGADGIVHIGHLEYPLQPIPDLKVKILYLPAYYNRLLTEETLSTISTRLEEKSASSVTVSSTIVESKIRRQIHEYLSEKGFESTEILAPILGCMYAPLVRFDSSVDAHILVAGGLFHHLGAFFSLKKPVISVDPYRQEVMDYTNEFKKYVSKRLFLVSKVKNAPYRTVGLVVGTRPGQHRPELVRFLGERAEKRGYKPYVISSAYLSVERLMAIDNSLGLDFYVVTSCPRLPIDDLGDFYKPVLTPGEFLMILNDKEEYAFPW
ncbi:MAG: diphthamide biosynthesis enzyme Dph2 [Thermosphaera sp.]